MSDKEARMEAKAEERLENVTLKQCFSDGNYGLGGVLGGGQMAY